MKKILTKKWMSPLGELFLGVYNKQLCLCDWVINEKWELMSVNRLRWRIGCDWAEGSSEIIDMAISELEEYFSGRRYNFDIPIIFYGTTFQVSVWKELTNIHYGSTISYSDLAERIGNPKAVRAVGSAVSKNPISIIVPCHRVVGRDKTLVGYAGGLEKKKSLLDMEFEAIRKYSNSLTLSK